MKTAARFVLLSVMFVTGMYAQTWVSHSKTSKAPSTRAADVCGCDITISSGVAEKLLLHKVDPDQCPHIAMAARVTGTVVVEFEIDKRGNVLHPKVVTGPRMLQKAALDAVRKYKYKPYLLNGKAIDVETTVSVVFDLEHSCPSN